MKSGTVTPNNIYVKNLITKSYLINGSNISFSKDGLGYTNTMRFDFNTVK